MSVALDVTDSIDKLYETIFTGTNSIFALALYAVIAVALWKVFEKAGYPGVLALIPIVNVFIVVKIAGYSAWMALLYLIPIIGWIFGIVVAIRVGERFGKGAGFSFFLLWLLPFIGYFIVGFGDARYRRA
ncbi:MAG: hypothetical protein J7484_13295 [Microbacterium sp.]|nr:hypothetical protein [Microbacterium sp.]